MSEQICPTRLALPDGNHAGEHTDSTAIQPQAICPQWVHCIRDILQELVQRVHVQAATCIHRAATRTALSERTPKSNCGEPGAHVDRGSEVKK